MDRASDESLMERVAQGDRNAFSCLMDRHKDRVYTLAFKMLGTHEEAEDATQEIFMRLWSHAGKYIPTAKFTTWLYAVSANMCRTRLRSVWRRFIKLKEEDCDHPAKDSTRPDVLLLKQERQARISKAIQELPANQRIALTLWRYENLSYKEISEVMGCSVAKVETLLFRAKNALRIHLDT